MAAQHFGGGIIGEGGIIGAEAAASAAVSAVQKAIAEGRLLSLSQLPSEASMRDLPKSGVSTPPPPHTLPILALTPPPPSKHPPLTPPPTPSPNRPP